MNIQTETYESLLPFLVMQAIGNQDLSFNSISVKIMERGWAWLVTGRKLLVWKFKDTDNSNLLKSRRILSPCYDLQLSQSDLMHRADLISVFFMPQNPNISIKSASLPAALAISPEGLIRFWSSVATERFYEATVCDIQGQEFCSLVALSSLEYLLATTCGSIFQLTIDINSTNPKNVLSCTPLHVPSGLLSGFSRRMTNLFFGPAESDVATNSKRPLIAIPKYSKSTIDMCGSSDQQFFVLTSSLKLRQWSHGLGGPNGINQLIKECDLQTGIMTKLISGLGLPQSDQISVWPIDMITTKSKELMILLVVLDTSRNNAINYATCRFNPYQIGEDVSQLTILRSHSWSCSNESEDQLLSMRFLERRLSSNLCFMHDRKFLFLLKTDHDILDAIDYGNQNDGILGAGMIEDHPLLFTHRTGLTYVKPVMSDKSRLNETSIQLDPAQIEGSESHRNVTQRTAHDGTRAVDPMVVDIEVEEEVIPGDQFRDHDESKNYNDRNRSVRSKMMNESGMNRSAADHSRREIKTLTEILRENKEFEWVLHIDSKQYAQASQTLAKLSDDPAQSEDRRQTLSSLSKIARLAT